MSVLIGVTTYRETVTRGPWTQDSALLPWTYIQSIMSAGGRPLLLPPVDDDPNVVLDQLDGLVVTGGRDVSPRQYNTASHPETTGTQPARDTAELLLIRSALKQGVPLLGVCRGMQLLNVACGGTLEQHLPDRLGHNHHSGAPGEFNTHRVRIDPDSRIGQVTRGPVREVRSHHHQGIAVLGSTLAAVAWATNDETIEAIERDGDPFTIGVLWHPEESDGYDLFAGLVGAAQARSASRRPRDTLDTAAG